MTEPHIDPRIAAPEDCVTGRLIDRWAAAQPDKVYAVFPDGAEWTYAELRERVRRTALGLQRLGVRQGDHVVSWLPNGPDALRVWFALNYLGAVYVPINIAYRGGLLAHVIENSDASLIVAHADLAPRLAEVDRAKLRTLVCLSGRLEACGDLEVLGADVLDPKEGELAQGVDVHLHAEPQSAADDGGGGGHGSRRGAFTEPGDDDARRARGRM